MRRSPTPLEKLALASSAADPAYPPARVVNSWLPALQKSPKHLRSFKLPRELAQARNNNPFNYNDLLEEAARFESGSQRRPTPSTPYRTNLDNVDDSAKIPNSGPPTNRVQPNKPQREPATSLEDAHEAFQSLQSTVRRLETSLARYEIEMMTLRQLASSQTSDQSHNKSDERIAEFKTQIRMFASLLVAQNEQIECLKTASMSLAARSDSLTKHLQAVEIAQRRAQESVQFQTESIKLLSSELQAGRTAADCNIAKLICELQHKGPERPAAELNTASNREEVALLLSRSRAAS